MTHEKMPEALRKIAHYNDDHLTATEIATVYSACDELECQHAEIQRLREEVEGLRKDAEMLQFMSDAYLCVDFRYGEPACEVIVFEMPKGSSYCGDLKTDLARIMQSTKEQP